MSQCHHSIFRTDADGHHEVLIQSQAKVQVAQHS